MPPFIKINNSFVELNDNFNQFKFRSEPIVGISNSTCCGEQYEVIYKCEELRIQDLKYTDCIICKHFKKN